MLMIEQGRRLPPLARSGLVAIVIGALTEIVMSLTASPHAMHHGMGVGHIGHLIALVGMVLVLAGVAIFGARGQRSRRASAANSSGGLESHALR